MALTFGKVIDVPILSCGSYHGSLSALGFFVHTRRYVKRGYTFSIVSACPLHHHPFQLYSYRDQKGENAFPLYGSKRYTLRVGKHPDEAILCFVCVDSI
jgi:NAD-dependent dihydropyrimidine dehydrogenase PreA subunit